ncbi:trypsin-like serine protease [Nitrosomonas sp.]|uniref:trypsin-like serine protease n=1 Tax=Nitrosomonas sp. TaxID=42353 RepID=UPI0025F4FC3A|nr:trypsin-like serine protease [Nitrosomonas sp.]MBV6448700.1 hypothetical protein [Nitrosomonas sp.]
MKNNLYRMAFAVTTAIGIYSSAHAMPIIDLDRVEEFTPLMIASDNPDNWIAPIPSILDGMGKLILHRSDGNFGCSGSLLGGGDFLITAAHCVTDDHGKNVLNSANISFQGGAVSTTASKAYVFSGWDGHTLGDNDDIAILKLDTPVTTINGYGIAMGGFAGLAELHAGYGLTGTGLTGAQSGTFGILHYGYNTYDATWGGSSGSLAYDFDNGTPAHDAFCIVAGICNLGLGSAEAMISPGDSGGASFIMEGGLLKLVGVHSFGATFGISGGDIDGTLNSSFGEAAGDTYLLPHLAWINSVTTIPEPQTYLMMLIGLLVISASIQHRK